MFAFCLEVTRKDKIRNENVGGAANFRKLGDTFREGRLRWFRHVHKRESGYVGMGVAAMKKLL